MIHGLIGRQLRNWRQDAERVRRQHDDVARHRAHIVGAGVRDEIDWIGTAAVFGQAVVIQIDDARIGIHHDIFQHRAETAGGGVNLGFGFGGKPDHLGIAAAFEVEDGGIGPAMFIIADQRAAGVGRKRGLPGARQAEEDRGIAVCANIGRAVHRHHALQRQQIVEDGEDALLHLASVRRAADQDGLAFEIHRHDGFAAAAVAGRIGLEAGQIDDGIFRHEGGQIGQFRAHQQGADEQAVPGKFGDDAHLHAVFGLAAAKKILHEQVALALQCGFEISLDGC